MDNNLVASVVGSVTPDGIAAFGAVIRKRKGTLWDIIDYRMVAESATEKTPSRMVYMGITKVAGLIGRGESLTIYTRDENAAKVFSGRYKGHKHIDLIQEFKRYASTRKIEVKTPLAFETDVLDGLDAAEKLCKVAIRDRRKYNALSVERAGGIHGELF